MVRAFVSEEDILFAAGASPQAVQDAAAGFVEGQRAWLRRKKTEPSHHSWRPKKRHRRATWLLLQDINHQVSQVLPGGLLHFAQPRTLLERQSWFLWPCLNLPVDLGSDNVAASCYLESAHNLNVDLLPDPAHGVHDDAKLSLRASGHWNMIQLYMIAHNVPHGPYNEDLRYEQVVRVLSDWFESSPNAAEDPLFVSVLPSMLRATGRDDLLGRCDAAEHIKEFYRLNNPFETKGSKLNMNRFMGYVKEGVHECTHSFLRLRLYPGAFATGSFH